MRHVENVGAVDIPQGAEGGSTHVTRMRTQGKRRLVERREHEGVVLARQGGKLELIEVALVEAAHLPHGAGHIDAQAPPQLATGWRPVAGRTSHQRMHMQRSDRIGGQGRKHHRVE